LLPKYNFNLDSNDHKVFRAIVNLANDLNKNIIVEGVEDDIQVEYLKAFNVQSLQGYFFSEPVDSEGFTHLLT
jgi:EAL domain-containing protein (putative c-di-GMP-specific phosphodiesterase class I)